MSDPTPGDSPRSENPYDAPRKAGFRMWPAIAIVAVMVLAHVWAVTGEPAPEKFFYGMLVAPLVCFVAILVWWLFFSRLSVFDKLLGFGVLAASVAVPMLAADKTMRSVALAFYVLPVLLIGWAAWLLLSFSFPWFVRRIGVLAVFATCGIVSSLARLNGMDGSFNPDFSWRWTTTSEQRHMDMLKAAGEVPAAPPMAGDLALQPGDWPEFRGPHRDARLSGVRIKTDWQQSPPKQLWKHLIGPGWSSFAVIGNCVFTQEQRGDDEYTVCYDAETGREIWSHHNAARFEEAIAGPGPRATPTFDAGRLYVLGGKGTLDCLQASTGKLIWSRDIVADTGAEVPMWGFASSPLVAHGIVSVYAGGHKDKAVIGYAADSGKLAWTGGEGALSYSSPQVVTIDGTEQILMASSAGLDAIDPVRGKVLWQYAWPVQQARIVQPALLGSRDLLIGTGMGQGTRRISVSRQGDHWQSDEAWTTKKLKPYFNDMVVVDDCIYGIDGSALVCVSMNDQNMKWRTGAYGAGQVLLLADQKLLLVMAERGDVALVKAAPEKYEELCRFKALNGKTWNHPVIAHEKLFVRNGEEIACFKLELLDSADAKGTSPKAAEPAKKVATVPEGGDQKPRDLK